jgi:hypothetical protein
MSDPAGARRKRLRGSSDGLGVPEVDRSGDPLHEHRYRADGGDDYAPRPTRASVEQEHRLVARVAADFHRDVGCNKDGAYGHGSLQQQSTGSSR